MEPSGGRSKSNWLGWFTMGMSFTGLPWVMVRAIGVVATRGLGPTRSLLAALLLAAILRAVVEYLRHHPLSGGSKAPVLRPGQLWAASLAWLLAVGLIASGSWHLPSPIALSGMLLGGMTLPLLALVWWPLLPGRRRTRFPVLGICISWAVLSSRLLEFQGMSGDGRPLLDWRTTSTTLVANDAPHTPSSPPIPLEEPPQPSAQYLGPDRSGTYQVGVQLDWIQIPPQQVWRHAIGSGLGSFAVWGELAYTQEQREQHECVVAYGLRDGAEVWVHQDMLRFEGSVAGAGPRATPSIGGDTLVSVGATGRLNCLDRMTGAVRWSRDLGQDAADLPHGSAASPLIWQDLVIACPVNVAGPALAAYALSDGTLRWSAGDGKTSYSSPHLAVIAGVDVVLLHYQGKVEILRAATGESLGQSAWANRVDTYASQPVMNVGSPSQFVVTAGYDAGAALFRVEPNPSPWRVETVWTSRHLKTKFTTAVLHNQTLYGLDNGILCAVDSGTGELLWKQGRYGHGQLLALDDYLLVQAESGELALVAADPHQWRELARIEGLAAKTWNVPCLAWPYLLVRNDQEAIAFHLQGLTEQ